jgi:hypothetical protein
MSRNVPGGKRRRALLALLSAPTITAAADRAGVSAKTLYRWLDDAAFLSALRTAQRQVFDRALGSLQAATAEAVDTLRTGLAAALPPTRIRAAIAVVDLALRATEAIETEARLQALEAIRQGSVAERPKGWPFPPSNGDRG